MKTSSSAAFLLLVQVAAGLLESSSLKHRADQLRQQYDFIVAGGGTAGLTIADRLSERLPDKTVLVVEYGEIEFAPGIFDPPNPSWGYGGGTRASNWTFESLPNPEVDNKKATIWAGKVVGGGSAINGMFFDRAARQDFEAWTRALGPNFDPEGHDWSWKGVFPYFKKSVTFTEPTAEMKRDHGFTWDVSAYGGTTPIYASFPPYHWADRDVVRDSWLEMGINARTECAGGDKDGVCWVPTSQHPITSLRSHAGLGHYAAVNESRTNYDLLVKHQVVRVIFSEGLDAAPVVEVRSLTDDTLFNITSVNEVILSSGALHTPTILQRSGIGQASFLEEAKIPVVLDLPGVGANLQDHSGPSITWEYRNPAPWSPLPKDLANASFLAETIDGFYSTPARGPCTMATPSQALWGSLPNCTSNFTAITSRISAIASTPSLAASYLPPSLASDPTILAGYQAQLAALAALYADSSAPSFESPFATGTNVFLSLLHPLSRGTVRLDPSSPLGAPIIDLRVGTNPIDFEISEAHVRYLLRMFETPTMKKHGAVPLRPTPEEVASEEGLRRFVKSTMRLSDVHMCGTVAMLPRELGGVLGPDLRVHGAKRLRVVDLSITPLLISAHTSATVYAMAEKLADIMVKEWKAEM